MTASPTISVVVPTYRRADRLVTCLAALADLDAAPEEFEVVVVDDGSPEPMASVAAPFDEHLQLRVHRQHNAGPAAARNTGATLARGTHLAFTDDDCAPRPAWLSRLADGLAAHPRAMVGGSTVNALPANLWSAASQMLVTYICAYYANPGRDSFLASNNIAMPTAAFLDAGGFDTTYPRPGGEDREFCDRWLRRGHPIVRTPAAVVDHAHELDWRGFWRQHTNYGRGAFHYHRQRAERDGAPVQVEPAAFYAKLLAFPFHAEAPPRATVIAGLLGLAQIANAAGFAAEHLGRGQET